jgi:type IV pilus assembly protein PilA
MRRKGMFNFFNKKKKDNKGFTLVELVIVIAILAILVGLLAPQYTKYVEKSRKTADVNNLTEMVKAVQIYAADPASELEADTYTITIHATAENGVANTVIEAANSSNSSIDGLKASVESAIPDYTSTLTKSKKWGTDGAASAITAVITVTSDGGTTVSYTPEAMASYVKTGTGTVSE